MSKIPNLKAIKDWCIGKFQPKGNYLTSIPNGYVTSTELENKEYTTMAAVEEKGYITETDLEGMVKVIYATSEPDTVENGTIVAVYEE